jgi:hypothetical protein
VDIEAELFRISEALSPSLRACTSAMSWIYASLAEQGSTTKAQGSGFWGPAWTRPP